MIVSGRTKVKAVAAGFGGAVRRAGGRERLARRAGARVAGHRVVVVMHKPQGRERRVGRAENATTVECAAFRRFTKSMAPTVNRALLTPFAARLQPPMRVTAATACPVASAAQQSTTIRSGIERSHVSWRLQSWRVAKMPLSRIVS